jgi:glycine cleavage system H lipoate-binding protein
MVALFVILTILACVGIDGVVQLKKARRESATRELTDQLVPVDGWSRVSAPADAFLDEGHTWVRVTPFGNAHVGMDSFAEGLIGRIDDVVLPDIGREVRRGDMLFAVRQNNRRAAFASPVDGVVTNVDKDLHWHPEMIHADPYRDGWICSVKPRNLASNLKMLRVADEAKSWLREQVQQFKEFFAARPIEDLQLGKVLADGGQLRGGVLEFADDETWKQFNEMFLHPGETKES